MNRRVIRILCLVGLGVLLGTAIVTQFCRFLVCTPNSVTGVNHDGVLFNYRHIGRWDILCARQDWNHRMGLPSHKVWSDLLARPFYLGSGTQALFLPWWLLLATWGLLTAVVWRLTCCRKVRGAFPVERAAVPRPLTNADKGVIP